MRSTEGGRGRKGRRAASTRAAKPVTQLWVCLLFYSFRPPHCGSCTGCVLESDDMTHENQTSLGRQPTGGHATLIGMLGLGIPSLEPPRFCSHRASAPAARGHPFQIEAVIGPAAPTLPGSAAKNLPTSGPPFLWQQELIDCNNHKTPLTTTRVLSRGSYQIHIRHQATLHKGYKPQGLCKKKGGRTKLRILQVLPEDVQCSTAHLLPPCRGTGIDVLRQWPPEIRVQQAFSPHLSLLPMLVVKAAARLDFCRISLHVCQLHVVLGGFSPNATVWLALSALRHRNTSRCLRNEQSDCNRMVLYYTTRI